MAFDCLWADGRDLREQALRDRRDQLEAQLEGQDLLLPAQQLADDGLRAWAQVIEHGYEGLVAKASADRGWCTSRGSKLSRGRARMGKPTERG